MKKGSFFSILIIFLIIICVILAYILVYWGKGTEEVNDIYQLTIKPDFDEPFLVYIPLALKENGDVAKIMKEVKITDGKGTFEIIKSEKGRALKIEANDTIQLIGYLTETNEMVEKTKSPYFQQYFCWGLALSMYENEIENNWIGFDEENLKIADAWIYANVLGDLDGLNLNITLEYKIRHKWDPTQIPGGTAGGGMVVDKTNIEISINGWHKTSLFREAHATT